MSAPSLAAADVAAVDFGQGVSNAWSSIVTFVPKLLAFLLILLIGWLVAKAVAKAVNKLLERVGFDRVVERGGVKRMLARSKYDASDIIAKLLYFAILLITLQIAFGVWGPNSVSALLTGIVAWLPRAAVAIVIIVVAAAIARAVKDLITATLGGLSYGNLLGTLASVFIWGLGIIAALNQIGVATAVTTPVLITVLATIGGIAVIGVGGGLVRPMQQRWERWLNKAEEEIPAAKAQAQAYQRGREDAMRSNTTPATDVSGAQTMRMGTEQMAGVDAQGRPTYQAGPQGYPQGTQGTGFPPPPPQGNVPPPQGNIPPR